MDDSHITLVQDSFAKVVPIKDTAAELFYARLFEIAPEVKPLFADSDMAEQGSKLMGTLAVVVNGLRDLPALLPVASDLARRHVDYGVAADHYAPVGQALIDTLEKGLGDACDAPTREAWATAYGTLSGAMIAAAYGEEA